MTAHHADPVVARASGVLDSFTADRLQGELLALTVSGRVVVLDLADVELIDSGAITVILGVARYARSHGGHLVLRNPVGVVADVLAVAALGSRLLTIEIDVSAESDADVVAAA